MGSNAERKAQEYWASQTDGLINEPPTIPETGQKLSPEQQDHDDQGWIVVAMPGSLLALVGVVCALGYTAGSRVPHGAQDAVIPATATEISNMPGQSKEGRTFSLEQRSGGKIDPILCAGGTPPVKLRDLGSSVIVFCKDDTIPAVITRQEHR